jgi:hypothetical protein
LSCVILPNGSGTVHRIQNEAPAVDAELAEAIEAPVVVASESNDDLAYPSSVRVWLRGSGSTYVLLQHNISLANSLKRRGAACARRVLVSARGPMARCTVAVRYKPATGAVLRNCDPCGPACLRARRCAPASSAPRGMPGPPALHWPLPAVLRLGPAARSVRRPPPAATPGAEADLSHGSRASLVTGPAPTICVARPIDIFTSKPMYPHCTGHDTASRLENCIAFAALRKW